MTLIQRLDGTIYDPVDYGINTVDVIISSPNPINNFTSIEGGNGVIDDGTTFGPRDILVQYHARSNDSTGFSLLRDEIFDIFRTDKAFYLIEKRLRGKRWLVKIADQFQIPQRNIIGHFSINFVGIKGFSESVLTTKSIDTKGIDAQDGLWGFGMGLQSIDETLVYKHTIDMPNKIGSFKIFNAGNIPIHHPFEQNLKVTITGAVGVPADGIMIYNLTIFSDPDFVLHDVASTPAIKYNKTFSASATLAMDNSLITLNSNNVFRDTEKTFIYLVPGWNEIAVMGPTKVTVEFDFPFYYL